MNTSMDVGVVLFVVVSQGVEDLQGFLGGGGVV
jgi:hypothetical protein